MRGNCGNCSSVTGLLSTAGVMVVSLFAAVSASLAADAALPEVTAAFGNSGLTAVTVAGRSIPADGTFRVTGVRVTDTYRNPYEMEDPYFKDTRTFRDAPTEVVGTAFDPQTRVLTRNYAWGAVSVLYKTNANRLGMTIKVQNSSKDVIEQIGLDLLTLTLPADPKIEKGYGTRPQAMRLGFNLGDVSVISAVPPLAADSMFTVYSPQPDRPLVTALRTGAGDGKVTLAITSGDERATEVYDDVWNARPIKPGAAETIEIEMSFGPVGSDPYDLAADACRKLAEAKPMVLNWPDRRPIMAVHFSNTVSTPDDPRGWWVDLAATPINTPEGKLAFKAWVTKFTDGIIATCEKAGAQGIIVWNVEGQQFPKACYYGDPRLLPYLAPEMDEVADTVFQRIRDAGFRVGFCLRPQEIRPIDQTGTERASWDGLKIDDLKDVYAHGGELNLGEKHSIHDPNDASRSVLARLSERIDYARKRWGATLFYVDTNFFWRAHDKQKPNSKGGYDELVENSWASAMLNADVFRALAKKYPDTLFVPEFGYAEYWSACAPYQQPPKYGDFTRKDVRDIYPEAFSLLCIGEWENFKARKAEYVAALEQGDLMMGLGWFGPEQAFVDTYAAAAESAPVKVVVAKDGALKLHGEDVKDAAALKRLVAQQVMGKPLPQRRVFVEYDKAVDRSQLTALLTQIGQSGGIITWTRALP